MPFAELHDSTGALIAHRSAAGWYGQAFDHPILPQSGQPFITSTSVALIHFLLVQTTEQLQPLKP
jgi:hypothetical protein